MSTISLYFPDEPFGITLKQLVWTGTGKDGFSTRPSLLHSLTRYPLITARCSLADSMLLGVLGVR